MMSPPNCSVFNLMRSWSPWFLTVNLPAMIGWTRWATPPPSRCWPGRCWRAGGSSFPPRNVWGRKPADRASAPPWSLRCYRESSPPCRTPSDAEWCQSTHTPQKYLKAHKYLKYVSIFPLEKLRITVCEGNLVRKIRSKVVLPQLRTGISVYSQLLPVSNLCWHEFPLVTYCIYFKTWKVLTRIARDSPQDSRQTGQRSASSAVVHLQHGRVLISNMRRDDQVRQIPLMDVWNFIQAQFLQQGVLHILVRKSGGEAEESGAQNTSAEEIHESKPQCDKAAAQ